MWRCTKSGASMDLCHLCTGMSRLRTLKLANLPVRSTFRRTRLAFAQNSSTGSPARGAADELVVASTESSSRLDAFVSERFAEVSRAKVQSSIKEGLIFVNGRSCMKPGQRLRTGDKVAVTGLVRPPPTLAAPEDIPLDIAFEDEHLMVINKPAGMVVHPAPGNYSGTLVNAVLHHLGLPAMGAPAATLGSATGMISAEKHGDGGSEEDLDIENEDDWGAQRLSWQGSGTLGGSVPDVVRPGIVHRLDKGTSGLLVVAKSDPVLAHLCGQFKDRTVDRMYLSVVNGVPSSSHGTVRSNIGRDVTERKRMASYEYGSRRGRPAASNWQKVEELGAAAAVVRWKLETGRTHQIRVHAKQIGHPLVMDETYGGTVSRLTSGIGKSERDKVLPVAKSLSRPALHAMTLAFDHPVTGERLHFRCLPPEDLLALLKALGSGMPLGVDERGG